MVSMVPTLVHLYFADRGSRDAERPAWPVAIWVALLLMVCTPWAMAQLLSSPGAGLWAGLGQVATLAQWQLLAWQGQSLPAGVHASAVLSALALDVPFIAAYATVLAWWVTAAFAAIARLRQMGQVPSVWLQRLGWALPLAVLADGGEDLLSAACITLGARTGGPAATVAVARAGVK